MNNEKRVGKKTSENTYKRFTGNKAEGENIVNKW